MARRAGTSRNNCRTLRSATIEWIVLANEATLDSTLRQAADSWARQEDTTTEDCIFGRMAEHKKPAIIIIIDELVPFESPSSVPWSCGVRLGRNAITTALPIKSQAPTMPR